MNSKEIYLLFFLIFVLLPSKISSLSLESLWNQPELGQTIGRSLTTFSLIDSVVVHSMDVYITNQDPSTTSIILNMTFPSNISYIMKSIDDPYMGLVANRSSLSVEDNCQNLLNISTLVDVYQEDDDFLDHTHEDFYYDKITFVKLLNPSYHQLGSANCSLSSWSLFNISYELVGSLLCYDEQDDMFKTQSEFLGEWKSHLSMDDGDQYPLDPVISDVNITYRLHDSGSTSIIKEIFPTDHISGVRLFGEVGYSIIYSNLDIEATSNGYDKIAIGFEKNSYPSHSSRSHNDDFQDPSNGYPECHHGHTQNWGFLILIIIIIVWLVCPCVIIYGIVMFFRSICGCSKDRRNSRVHVIPNQSTLPEVQAYYHHPPNQGQMPPPMTNNTNNGYPPQYHQGSGGGISMTPLNSQSNQQVVVGKVVTPTLVIPPPQQQQQQELMPSAKMV